jgi:hypothetical protein
MAAVKAEAALEDWKQRIAMFQYSQRGVSDTQRYEDLPGGGVRDWGEGGRWREDSARPLDPVYDARPAAPEDEMTTEVEKVPGAGHSLSRSVPRPRNKSMRRGASP